MKQRIVWMDWCKTISMLIVIHCHLPQDMTLPHFYGRYFILSTLFFMSGYLHKIQPDAKTAARKYWKTLIIPYLLMEVVFYPYWLVRAYFTDGLVITDLWESLFRPFLLSLVGIPLNGVMYYMVILIICKVFTDIFLRGKYRLSIAVITSLICIAIAYVVHYQQRIVFTYSIDHFFDNFQFFVMGYFARQWGFFEQEKGKAPRYFAYSMIFLAIGLIVCYFEKPIFLMQRIDYEIVSITGTFFLVNLCRCFYSIPNVVLTFSRGMIILFGIHWMFIGTANMLLPKLFGFPEPMKYTIFSALVFSILIMAVCYFIIIFCQKHFKAILGGR